MIHGEKVVLTCLERQDLTTNYLWGNDPELIHLAGMTPYPKSSWQIEQWFQQSLNNSNALTLAVRTKDAQYIGNIELSNIDCKNSLAELGLILGEKNYWKQGFAADALKTLINFAFKEMNLRRISARVLSFNKAGISLFKGASFKEEGRERKAFYTDGKYWDIIIFGLLKDDLK